MLAVPAVAGVPDPSPDWLRRIESGDVALEAHTDPTGRGGQVRAMIDIAAPPQVVWATILDCGRAARMTPSVKRCTVLSRDPSGREELREHVVKWSFLLPALHSTSRLALEPYRRIAFRCEAGDIRDCEGQWLLEPRDGGRGTRVTYENRATAPFGLPDGVTIMAMRRDVPTALRALRRESVAAAR
ncbi:SRPBCC family protein [Caulobacter sp. UNC279MFTsu5.1]|uniref:SRPBCC family protein n=1 Tax=Caulobacter sp. UNC279MFTsu5.1 TaxID=1502775 RepID=UPI0008E79506|nr:SRPBCC family protein [Caulobacter sp. UNC279MFTsu5.1]SFJ92867.1 Polyketide cyclase / dehydrase and lipid transport [Caulobacter sp. UNC279MFTsu5.1]